MFLSDLWYTIGDSERMERATFTTVWIDICKSSNECKSERNNGWRAAFTTTLTTFCKSLEKVRTSDDLWLFIESTMKSMPKWSKDEYVKTVFNDDSKTADLSGVTVFGGWMFINFLFLFY